ncbi:UPF0547 protein C16orf87 homolog [Mya arenaria]|uniref:UPF0547 protein C16orf87 homolog n=1 Tax=Mya arenaria TaxID=6604 RepID=UPI0022E5C8E0|nr:UPF0547 protein C16orf87 homolog [Mya arenaria]
MFLTKSKRFKNIKMSKNSNKGMKVVKKCSECEREIPVACKTCPLCKSLVVSTKAQKTPKQIDEDKDSEAKIRRTERIRRERPDFFNSLELDNQFKKKRKRKESTESRGRVSLSSPTEPEGKILQVEESEVPKKRRGRPRSVANSEISDKMSETKSPQPEEDWYAHLPSEKLMQYQIILAEINRKVSTQNFNPV